MERARACRWWTGRITDQEIAEWTGLAPRAVTLVLNIPSMRNGIVGGGRGSYSTRRLGHTTKNGVAIIAAGSRSGLQFELIANLISADAFIATDVAPIIDFVVSPLTWEWLAKVDPEGGWLENDSVPDFVWNRYVYRCRDVKNNDPTAGNVLYLQPDEFKPNTPDGTMIVDRTHIGLENLELTRIDNKPIYYGEIDPLGLYAPATRFAESFERYDEHLLIADGKWAFRKIPDPDPYESMKALLRRIQDPSLPLPALSFRYRPFAQIDGDGKTVHRIDSKDAITRKRADFSLRNASSVLDLNVTLAVRKMKRRALGLEVSNAD